MVNIMKRKKKGRLSKSDLAAAEERELRRSGRRRNVRYNFDYDDYLDDDQEYYFVDQHQDQNRKAKKLKLLLKLDEDEEGDEVENDAKGVFNEDAQNDEEDYYDDKHDEDDVDDDVLEVKKRKKQEVIKEVESAPGTPTEESSGFPLPDKKILVLILDKLQKKDIYGVYAEPVDPEELPDYHEIIEHPMDFSTIRSRLANGSYSTLDQLESDVFLLCSNAMQYNEADTIYHKQARSIQEMAKKKFQKLRAGNGRSKSQMKLVPNPKPASLSDNQIRKQIIQIGEEFVSDFTSGATLATAGDFQNGSNAVQANGIRRATSSDGLVEGTPPVIDTSLDKVEESVSAKGSLTRFGKKLPLHDEDRRATYNIACQPETISESVLSTFDGESKQLIPVGLHIDHAYASSLARFAGSLGPVAWRIASQRIEQILPPGIKFGHGWVGEYEPLSTPVLILENCTIKEPDFFAMPHHTNNTSKGNMPKTSITSKNNVTAASSNVESQYSTPKELKTTTKSNTSNPTKELVGRSNLKGKPPVYCAPVTNISASSSPHLQHQTCASSSPHLQRQTSRMRKLHEHDKKALEQVELNGPPSTNHSSAHLAVERQVSNGSEASTPRSAEMVSINTNFLHSGSFKHLKVSGVADRSVSNNADLPNGNVTDTGDGGRGLGLCSNVEKVRTLFPHGQERGLSDPVQQMRMLTEKSSIHKKFDNQGNVSGSPIPSPARTMSREDSSAAAVSARAWMSVGAGGFRPPGENMGPPIQISDMNPNQQPHISQFRGNFPVHLTQFQQTTSPFHAFAPQAVRVGNAAQFQNLPMSLPQFLTTDATRIQVQDPWRGLMPYAQQPQKQVTSPPDLNVSFQSPGSPAKPLSRVPVDSQQPDLALQL
ncbi:chromatin/chromatin-binding, or -regulatory protein [Lithospermum erythrorhizon]|uniref:Chromatin/chromatin-binding, or -regulatory protein n=1 Tax=Lithospermum erythrorhizon TaxID=34254 RepID=A0AAV3NQ82_LITER